MEIKLRKAIITDTELYHEKQSISLTEIKNVKYNPPGKITGGSLVVTPYYQPPIVIPIIKKEHELAEKIYIYLYNIAEQNQPPISKLEQDPTLNTFQCQIREEKPTTFGGTQTYPENATVKLYDDKIIINKTGLVTKLDKGTKTVLFQDVTSVDMDITTLTTYVILTMPGSPGVVLEHFNRPQIEKFYDLLAYKFHQFKRAGNTAVTGSAGSAVSDADELERWYGLMEKGIITEEEFNLKKKELLGL